MTTQQTLQTEEYNQTELGELPKEWDVEKIQDFVDFERGAEPGSDNYNDKRKGIRFLRVSDISGNRKEFIFTTSNKIKLCSPENILITFDGSPGIVKRGFTGAFSSGIRKVNLMSDSVDLEFIFYVLQTSFVQEVISKHSTGVTIKHASKSIPHIKIPIPPLPEQQKIAYVLSTVQTAQERTQNFINSLKELKKSAMKHLFTCGAVSFEDIDKVELKETEIGMMPKNWEIVELGSISEIKSGGTPSTSKKEFWENGTIPWVKSGKCQDCYINSVDSYITQAGLENSSTKMLEPNTILVAMVGATVGKTGLLTFSACTNQNVAGIYPKNKTKLNYLYLYYMLQSRYCDFTKTEGFVIANLSFIKKLPVPYPDFSEQQNIASILSAIDEKIQAEEQKKEALKETFNSLLKNLMTAKIRVNNLEVGA